jgi:peptidyl-prolyl cis-trans isomerase C
MFLLAIALVAVAVAQDKPADPVVIKAGELEIKKSEFEAALETIPPEYQAYASGPGKKAFAEDYLRMKLLAREAEKRGLDKKADIVQRLKLMRDNTLANAELERIQEATKLSDAELQKAYEERKGSYQQARARHILIAFKDSPAAQAGKTELTEEQAKAKAEQLRAKIVGGTTFEELATAESDDRASASRGGELGWFTKGQMVPEFEQAVFGGKPGELSPVVRTQFGYHIIKVDEHRTQPLADVKPQLEREMTQSRVQQRLDELKTASAPKFDEAYFAPPPQPPALPDSPSKP